MLTASYPPDQMYASPADDPALACQCGSCRNSRAVLPAPLAYDAAGYDQFGTDTDGYDRHGSNHQERHGRPGYRGTDASDLDQAGLREMWTAFPAFNRDAFLDYLRDVFTDPDHADEVKFCDSCAEPAWGDDMSRDGNGSDLCESCYDELSSCVSCDERYPDYDLYTTLGDNYACGHCRDNYYSWCEECDGYYHDEDAHEHDHDSDGSGCCESPQMLFSVRNDGDEPLANDTRTAIELPAGTISAEGIEAIRGYLRQRSYGDEGQRAYYDLTYDLDELGNQWQTKSGNYAKRLSRRAYQKHQLKLTPEILSQVGCIARDHSTQVSVTVDVTRDLNQDAGEFYHSGSCWWGEYSESRCALKTNGGFGLRAFRKDCDGYRDVSGRAWVLPLKRDERGDLVPTFETVTPDAFVVFNGYGDLEGYSAPRILAHMAGWTYRKISFSCHPMYVNAGGYLVAPEDIAEQYTDGSLSLSVPQHANLFQNENSRELVHA